MKVLILLATISVTAWAQLSTDATIPPVAEYDMLTAVGASLTDLSGSGNTGTIVGTTTNAQGRVCNGSSDYISMPQLIGNSDFTVIVIAEGNNPSTGGATWGESNASASQFVRFSTAATTWTQLNGSTTHENLVITAKDVRPDYDVYFARRTQNQLTGGMLSRVNQITTAPNTNIGTVTVTGGGASICALNEGASRVNFWAGTLSYFALYKFGLTSTQIQSVYQAMAAAVVSRPVFVHPYPSTIIPQYSNPVWQRQGVVLTQAPNLANEMSVISDSSCPTIGGSSCFRMWYTTNSGIGVGEAESVDGKVWTIHGGSNTTVLTNASHPIQPSVLKVNGTYHMYVSSTSNTLLDHYSSADGIVWATVGTAITRGSAGAWDSNLIANPSVLFNPDGSNLWYMLYGGQSDGTGIWTVSYRTGGATSTDGTTWTKVTANPMIQPTDAYWGQTNGGNGGIGNPWLAYINGKWYDWDGSFGIARFASPTFNGLWIWSQIHLSLFIASNDESNQLADPTLLEVNGVTYMWYNGYSTNSTGVGIIKLVTAPLPLSQLVLTNEGATTDYP